MELKNKLKARVCKILLFSVLLLLVMTSVSAHNNAAHATIVNQLRYIHVYPQQPALINPGDSATFDISAGWVGLDQPSNSRGDLLTVEWDGGGWPTGVLIRYSSLSLYPSGGSVLTISTTSQAVPGTYNFRVPVVTLINGQSVYFYDDGVLTITPFQTVTFTETGLPVGTNWNVTINGVTKSSTTNSIIFTGVHVGTQTWSAATQIPGEPGIRYIPSTPSGSISVPSQLTQNVAYNTQYKLTIASNGGSPSPYLGDHWYDSYSQATISAFMHPDVIGDEEYVWVGWVGSGYASYTGTDKIKTIGIENPVSETAMWAIADSRCYFMVDKQTDPRYSDALSQFTSSTGATFTLTDLDLPWNSGFQSPGTYTLTESELEGWALTDIVVIDPDGGSSIDLDTRTVTIDLDAGEIVHITFKNTQLGKITVYKESDPKDLEDFVFYCPQLETSFTLDDDEGVDGWDSTHNNSWSSGWILPGKYTITEYAESDWVLKDIMIQNDDGDSSKDISSRTAYIKLDHDENVDVTFKNRIPRGYIQVQVITWYSTNPDGFEIKPSFGDSFKLNNGDPYWESGPLTPGVYTFDENIPDGWYIYNTWDDDSSPGTTCDWSTGIFTVDLSDGETVTISYRNVQMGKMNVNLDAIPNDLEDFSFSIITYDEYANLVELNPITLDDDEGVAGMDSTYSNNWVSGWLTPGWYTITEDPKETWELTAINVVDPNWAYERSAYVWVDYGATATVTFQNTKISSGNTLTVDTDPSSVTGTTGSGSYTSGTAVTITAPEYQEIIAASSRYHFTGWTSSGGGSFDSTSSPSTTFTMPEGSATVTAHYETQYYLTVNDGGHGTAGGGGWYPAGSNAQATMTPLTEAGTSGTRYVFTGWGGDASGSGSPSDNILMNGPKIATALWKTQYQVTFVANPTNGGTINPTGVNIWEDSGTLSISATPNTGYSFDNWSTADSISFTSSTSASTTATISGSGTITANYVSFSQTPSATTTTTEISTGEPIGLGGVVYDSATVTATQPPVLYIGAGSPDNSEGDLTPSYPSGLRADDLLLLQLTVKSPGSVYATGPTITGWSKLGTSSINSIGQYIYFKWSDGTETGAVTITTSLGDTRTAMIYAFRNVIKSNNILDFVELGGSGGQGIGVSSISGPSVSTTGDGRLAVSFVSADEAVGIDSFTGETGGDWVEEEEYQYNPDGSHDLTMQLQTATIEASTGIHGGSASLSGTCNWVLDALALKPKPVTGTPTGSVTFYAKAPGAASWTPYGAVKSLSGGYALSDSFEPISCGTWYFKAEYSGDTSFAGSESGEEEEPLEVLAATTTTTELSPTSISLGATVTDTATVTGTTTLPVLYIGAGTPDNSGSGGLTPSYPSGLQANDLMLLHLTIRTPGAGAAFPTIPGWGLLSGNSANPLGQYVYFKWSDGTETGTVTITTSLGDTRTAVMYAFRNVVKSDYVPDFIEGGGGGQGIGVSSISAPSIITTGDNRLAVSFVSVDAAIDIGSFTGESGGDWVEEEEYQYNPGGSDLTMQLQTATIEAAGTISGGSVGLGSNNNWLIRDLALKPRTISPTGSVTFYVKAPGAASWTPYGTVKSLTSGTATADSYTPTSIGTWYFMAKYLGDDNFAGSQSAETAEPLTVGKATPTVVTDLSEDSITLGGSVTDDVTVNGLGGSYPDPTGSVDFQVSYDSGDWTTYDADVLLVSGTATSETYTPSTAGSYRFRAVYSGDSNYFGAQSGDNDEPLTVAVGFVSATISGTKSKYGGYGLEGWTIKLYDSGGTLYDSTTTDSNGDYSFTVNDPDTYVIKEVLKAGWTMTSPALAIGDAVNPTEVTGYTGVAVTSGDSITGKDFVNFQWSTITGINTDATGNPIEGWTIKLYDSGGTLYDSTTTDSNGDYSIIVKTPGTYDVVEVLPADWTMIYPGTFVGDDEEPMDVKGYTVKVATSGVSFIENDFVNARPNEDPAADIGGPYSGDEGSSINFDASVSSDSDGSIVLYEWDWNNDGAYDESSTTSATASHTWNDDGSYPIVLRVTDDDDATDTDTITVTVNDLGPTAAFSDNGPQNEGSPVQFTDQSTSSPDAITTWYWEFGDGDTNSDASPTHTYTNDGVYTVSLTVTDDDGSTDYIEHTVTVVDLGPTAEFSDNGPQNEGTPVQFTDASTSSPDTITSWSWNFDGLGTSTDQNPSFTFTDDGVYTVRLTVTDDDGSTHYIEHSVTVDNVAPSVDAGSDATIDEGDTFTGSGSFTDPGDDSWSATVDYGEGAGPQALSLTGKTFSLSNVYEQDGSYTVTIEVYDGDAYASDTLTVTVRPQLTVNTDPAEVGGTTGSGSYTPGEVVEISAQEYLTLADGSIYHFIGWTGTGIAETSHPSTTLTMGSSDLTATANYEELYSVTFTEIGLPAGSSWSVRFNGVTHESTTDTVTFTEITQGAGYSYSIVPVYLPNEERYAPDKYIETLDVSGDTTESITFYHQYRVTAKTTNDILGSIETSDTYHAINFRIDATILGEPASNIPAWTGDGSVLNPPHPMALWVDEQSSITIHDVQQYWPSIGGAFGVRFTFDGGYTEPVVINGPYQIDLLYITQYKLTLKTNGLPEGTPTNIYIGDSSESLGLLDDATYRETWIDRNTYTGTIRVESPKGGYLFTGWADGSSDNPHESLYMTAPHILTANYIQGCTVTFTESGLPEDTEWSVELDYVTKTSTGDTIEFVVMPDNSYPYKISTIYSDGERYATPIDMDTLHVDEDITVDCPFYHQYKITAMAYDDIGSTLGQILFYYDMTQFGEDLSHSGWAGPRVPGSTDPRNFWAWWVDADSTITITNVQEYYPDEDGESGIRCRYHDNYPEPILIDSAKELVFNYITQYKLTAYVDPSKLDPEKTVFDPLGDSVEVGDDYVSYWYDYSTQVTLTADELQLYDSEAWLFNHWTLDTLDYEVGVNPITLIMNTAKEATSHYRTLPVCEMTTGELQYLDMEEGLDGKQFRLLFTQDPEAPDTFKLTASNPGQFYYNVFYVPDGETYSLSLTIPEGFVTQGANPIQVYSDIGINPDGSYMPNDPVLTYAIDEYTVSGDTPESGFVYLTIHLDYNWEKTVGYVQTLRYVDPDEYWDASNNDRTIPDHTEYTFQVTDMESFSGIDILENINIFNKIPGFGGLVYAGDTPAVGFTVTIYLDDVKLGTATTDENGFYYYYYKHTSKPTEYTVDAGTYGKAVGTIKANKFKEENFGLT